MKADFIPSLVYLNTLGEARGYRRDLLTEDTPHDMKEFIFCSRCNGISRKPQFYNGKTFCRTCAAGANGTLDVRVEEFVTRLKCRCPLSTRGCGWLGELGRIEKHLTDCGKLRIECEMGCGGVLERCRRNNHQNICPKRVTKCDYCGQEVQASETNAHITLCQTHPDGEVTCPYKEMGCDVVGIKRKHLDAHLTENVLSHQNLLLREVNQLKLRSDGTTDKLQILQRRDVKMNKRIWTLVALVVMGVAILLSLTYTGWEEIQLNKHSIQSNEQSIQLNKHSIQSNEQSIQLNKHSIQSNEQSIQLNEHSIQSNEQSIQLNEHSLQLNEDSINLLLSRAIYLYDYIHYRKKTLHGIEWTHKVMKEGIIYGPIFSMGRCLLRLEVNLTELEAMSLTANYRVTRLSVKEYTLGMWFCESNEEIEIDSPPVCHITCILLSSMATRKACNVRFYSEKGRGLEVGDELDISSCSFMIDEADVCIVRFYYDFEI